MPYNRSEFLFLQGKTKWFRPERVNEWGKWSHVIYPTQEGIDKIRELQAEGVKNVLKKDEDGYFVTIGRNSEIRRKTDGAGVKVVGMQPPEIVDKDGKPLKGVAVGNGSDITTKVEVYQHSTPGGGKAKAMRWVATRVDNLIPYEPEKDKTWEEQLGTKNLDKQPEQDPF
jgi:hypothetical protein